MLYSCTHMATVGVKGLNADGGNLTTRRSKNAQPINAKNYRHGQNKKITFLMQNFIQSQEGEKLIKHF